MITRLFNNQIPICRYISNSKAFPSRLLPTHHSTTYPQKANYRKPQPTKIPPSLPDSKIFLHRCLRHFLQTTVQCYLQSLPTHLRIKMSTVAKRHPSIPTYLPYHLSRHYFTNRTTVTRRRKYEYQALSPSPSLLLTTSQQRIASHHSINYPRWKPATLADQQSDATHQDDLSSCNHPPFPR